VQSRGLGGFLRWVRCAVVRLCGCAIVRLRERHRCRGQAIEAVVDEALVEGRVGVGSGQQLAQQVVGGGLPVDGAGGAAGGGDVVELAGVGIEQLGGDDAVTGSPNWSGAARRPWYWPLS